MNPCWNEVLPTSILGPNWCCCPYMKGNHWTVMDSVWMDPLLLSSRTGGRCLIRSQTFSFLEAAARLASRCEVFHTVFIFIHKYLLTLSTSGVKPHHYSVSGIQRFTVVKCRVIFLWKLLNGIRGWVKFEHCGSQDELGFAGITNKPQCFSLSNTKQVIESDMKSSVGVWQPFYITWWCHPEQMTFKLQPQGTERWRKYCSGS